MKKVQEKLKECTESTSMKSLDRIAGILQNSQEPETMDTNNNEGGPVLAVDALETIKDFKGENKAPIKKSKKRKHSLKAKKPTPKEDKPKRRPKYFVQF